MSEKMAQQLRENPVEVTMVFTAVFRCRLCSFHAVDGEDMKDHMTANHQGATATSSAEKDVKDATMSQAYGTRRRAKRAKSTGDEYESFVDSLTKRVQTIFKDVTQSCAIKGLTEKDIALKVFPDTEDLSSKKRARLKRDVAKKNRSSRERAELAQMFRKILEVMKIHDDDGSSVDQATEAVELSKASEAVQDRIETEKEKLEPEDVRKGRDVMKDLNSAEDCGRHLGNTADKKSPHPQKRRRTAQPNTAKSLNQAQKRKHLGVDVNHQMKTEKRDVTTTDMTTDLAPGHADVAMAEKFAATPKSRQDIALPGSNTKHNKGLNESVRPQLYPRVKEACETSRPDPPEVAQLKMEAKGGSNVDHNLEKNDEGGRGERGTERTKSALSPKPGDLEMMELSQSDPAATDALPKVVSTHGDKGSQNESLPAPSLPKNLDPQNEMGSRSKIMFPVTPLPDNVMLKKDADHPSTSVGISKLFGKVDFQDIAQQASKSNPDATTITVVQHTAGNHPPTTIHFKKSRKSNAIIPTGESLGITSPFLHKGYMGSKIFACKECRSRYKTQNELERHIAKKHKKAKCYLCEICGDALATPSGMKIHIERKHDATKTFSCDACDYVTRSLIRFEVHQKKHSKGTSEFYCEACKKSFVSESKLQQHCNSPMHKNAVDPIICEHCGYVTKKRDNFLVHLRKHTGEKPYKCKHCHYAAADGSTLKRHVMARHSTIRPFRCSQCQFSCVDRKGLTVHMRKHTGERPYTCDQCPYSAKRMGALTVHMRTHQRDRDPSTPSFDLSVDGGSEVASYVDVSNLAFPASDGGTAQLQLQPQHSSQAAIGLVPVAASCSVITTQDASETVELPADIIVAKDTANTVRALWQACNEVKG